MNPFAALGLDARPDLTDDDIRTAWRITAAATHPDRADGGNPDVYAAASAAYAALRSPWARSEAYADLVAAAVPARPGAATAPPLAAAARIGRALKVTPARIRHGRPAVLVSRISAAAVLAIIALKSGAGTAPAAAAVTGIAIWLALTIRGDLAPPPGR